MSLTLYQNHSHYKANGPSHVVIVSADASIHVAVVGYFPVQSQFVAIDVEHIHVGMADARMCLGCLTWTLIWTWTWTLTWT